MEQAVAMIRNHGHTVPEGIMDEIYKGGIETPLTDEEYFVGAILQPHYESRQPENASNGG